MTKLKQLRCEYRISKFCDKARNNTFYSNVTMPDVVLVLIIYYNYNYISLYNYNYPYIVLYNCNYPYKMSAYFNLRYEVFRESKA